jgi:hypothetical protein
MKNLFILLLVCISSSIFAQKTNFSGQWTINKESTQFGDVPQWVIPKTIIVDQQKVKLILSRTSLNEQSEELPAIVENLSLDGSPFQRTPDSGPVVITSMHWANDSSFALYRNGSNFATETWTLENGGKTLVINRLVEQDNGLKYSIKCVYDKQ